MVIFPLLACLAQKRLQIDTDMLLVTTSTGNLLFSGIKIAISMTLNDLEPKNRRFFVIFAILAAKA